MSDEAITRVRGFGLISFAERLNDTISELSQLGAPVVDLVMRLAIAAQFFSNRNA